MRQLASLLKALFPLFLHPDNETGITNDNWRPLVFNRVYITFKIFEASGKRAQESVCKHAYTRLSSLHARFPITM